MPTLTLEEVCQNLKYFELSAAGKCDEEWFLFAPDREAAAEKLRPFDPPAEASHGWVDVIRRATFRAYTPVSAYDARQDTAAAPAVPVSQAGDVLRGSIGDMGTLGGIVADRSGVRYLLGAWHSTPHQENIHEQDTGELIASPAIQIGTFSPTGGSTDCAIASIVNGSTDAELKFKDSNGKRGAFAADPGVAVRGEEVELCGQIVKRFSSGTVLCPNLHCILVDLEHGTYKFNNQILIQGRFGQLGDSGGIVLRNQFPLLSALGLYYASSEDFMYSVAHPLTDIFGKIGAKLGSPVHL